MASAVVGSVTAELILDSKQFVSGLETAKEKIRGLSGNIGTGGLDALAKRVAEINAESKKLKESLSSLGKVQYGNPFAGWVDPVNELLAGMEKVNEGLFRQQEKLRLLKDEWLSFKVIYNGLLSTKPMDSFIADMDKANAQTRKFSSEFAKMKESMMGANYGSAGQFFIRVGEDIAKVGMESTKSGEQVANFEKQIIALKNAISSGRKFTILDGANGSLDSTSEKVAKLRAELELLYSSMSRNTTRGVSAIGNTVNQTSQQLSNLSRNVSQASGSFNNMTNSSTAVANSVSRMNGTFGGAVQNVRTVGTAYNTTSGTMNKYSESANKVSTSTNRASTGMNTLTSATTRLGSALSSVKMMATALSSMFIWTFGMSLYEATKLTLQSKNEMESYLNQMGMGRGAINLFNQGLDETADRFKKLNKYMIGETIASIGMEFDLTANQMKKSMEVVAMVQNEYVRAGRKESEASLAVKDILQGEFLRLSRETGVGKADLEATGLWQGDLKDVEGLMDALKKVGEDRHWDLFASKCLSLNDVMSETKNRISEFGASLADQLSPAIVNGFNMIIETIDKVTSTWESFDPSTKIAVGATAFLAFGTALMMVAGHLTLLDIAQMGYSTSLVATVLKLDIATVKEYGLATAITSKITALEGSTVAEMGNATAIASRLLGLEAELVAEHGLIGALGFSTIAKNANTIVTDANTLANEGNVIAKNSGVTITKAFTMVEELENAVKAENTALTEANTIIKELNAKANLSSFRSIVVFVTGLKAEEVQAMSTNQAIIALITSMTALEAIALVAVIASVAVVLGSLAMEAQRAKEAIDGFYDIVDNGDAYIDDSKKNIESLGKQYDNLGEKIAEAKAKGEDTWKMEQTQSQVKSNKEFAEAQLKDLEDVNQKSKDASKNYQDTITNANTDFERKNAEIFQKLGHDTNQARQYANQYTQQYLNGIAQMEKATNAYTSTLDTGVTHMEGQIDVLKEAGANQETLTQYAKDYGEEVLKNAQYQKEWAEGDFWAIFKIGLSDLKLAWIDFTYWVGQQDWWKDLCNALGEAKNAMGEFYNAIKPALPVLAQILVVIGSAIWQNFVNNCYGVYEVVKILYPVLREWAGLAFEHMAKLAEDLRNVYNTLKAIDDLRKGDTTDVMEWLNSGGKPKGYVSEDQPFDVKQYIKDFFSTDLVDYLPSITGSNMEFTLLNYLLPPSTKEQISSRVHEIMTFLGESITQEIDFLLGLLGNLDFIGSIINGLFNSGGSEGGEGGAGVAKDIPENNLIHQIIHSWVGDDPIGAIQSAVDINIVQPFSQAIQTGLANIPIIGSILSFLGLIDGASPTASEKGNNLAQSFGWAVENKIRSIPILGDILAFLGVIDSSYPTANSKGHGVGQNVHDGVNTGKQGTADLIRNEMWELIGAVAGAVADAYNYACQVGQAILGGINSVIQHHSPGIPAQLIGAEMEEINLAMANAVDGIYLQAQQVGNAITSGIQPTGEINFDAEAMAQYQADMMVAMGMAGETVDTSESAFSQLDYTTSLTFANIGTTIGTTMTNIANTTKLNYNNIALTTKTQLANMQSQTTKNIGAIRQSWTGMQIALINSAEHIRSETGAKINSLQNNMASFWRKVQNPALLLGAGDPSEQRKGARPRRYNSSGGGVRKILQPRNYAGAKTSTPNHSAGFSRDKSILEKLPKHLLGVSLLDKYEEQIMAYFSDANHKKIENIDIAMEYLKCLFSGGNCVAGGWDFNWSDDIKQALLTWHTHFGDIYDPYLYVGKFENDDFPIRGIAPIALNYIQDAIGRTQYEFYYDQKYGSPLEAWNAGHFNCYDGALLVMALASALGFPNSHMVHGSWGGIGHVWAYVEGLGNIDATAIQGGYGLTAPSRTGVAGTPTLQKRFKHNKNPSSSDENNGNVFNGDINIHIDGTGKNTEEIGREVRNVMVDLMSPNPATGI